jgi:hypothetical protein
VLSEFFCKKYLVFIWKFVLTFDYNLLMCEFPYSLEIIYLQLFQIIGPSNIQDLGVGTVVNAEEPYF